MPGFAGGHELSAGHVEHVNLPVLDHVVPAVQRELIGFHALAHHGVVHQPLQLQQHRTLLSAAEHLGPGLRHGQRGVAAQRQPCVQVPRLGRHAAVQRSYTAAMAVTTDDDPVHLQVQHRKLDRGGRAVVPPAAVIGRHKRAYVAHQEELARPGAREHVGHEARIAAAYEQGGRVLAIVHQLAEAIGMQRKRVFLKATQALQEVVFWHHCTSGVSAPSNSTPCICACPASNWRYWDSAVAKLCCRSVASTVARTCS